MFAGGRVEIARPLEVGQPAERMSQVSAVAVKQGKSGQLAFVTVRASTYANSSVR
ncbi:hypothetical protein [Nocardia sp. NPDC050175]|uniref:hypothetical protein n=1 Tax=Nocardia sp. NPDC050175 TaxID=3364317 RepID=UPI0037A15B2D